jgi:hypothetical protein
MDRVQEIEKTLHIALPEPIPSLWPIPVITEVEPDVFKIGDDPPVWSMAGGLYRLLERVRQLEERIRSLEDDRSEK